MSAEVWTIAQGVCLGGLMLFGGAAAVALTALLFIRWPSIMALWLLIGIGLVLFAPK